MNKSDNYKEVAARVAEELEKTAAEVDLLQVQTKLGKAEVMDTFEDLKKQLYRAVQEAEMALQRSGQAADIRAVLNALELLRVQLTLGIAESREVFETQQEKIHASLAQVLATVKKEKTLGAFSDKLNFEIEKFKVKLDLLDLHFKLDRISLQQAFDEKRKVLEEKIKMVRSSFGEQ